MPSPLAGLPPTDVSIAVLNRTTDKEVSQFMSKDQHVTPHGDNWQVKGAGNSIATAVVPTQKEAIGIARNIAINNGSEVVIHGTNGKIRQKNSYGNDPYPPKG